MTPSPAADATFLALSGGVGGAKLVLGLAEPLGDRLCVVVNTGDDFDHLGLLVSPDVDTALYTLAGIVNPATGWGRREETWRFMEALATLGGPVWFRLGDGDLATHVDRTQRLRAGATPSEVCVHLARRFGVAANILPMTDQRVRTLVETDEGCLAFQDYFVRRQCRPAVRSIRFEGAETARPSPRILEALSIPTLAGIVICPSNPWLSVDPILAVPGLAAALRRSGAPVVAVSPIVAGKALKGPAAKIMAELGLECSSRQIARHYAGLIDAIVIDRADGALGGEMQAERGADGGAEKGVDRGVDGGVTVLVTNTVMTTREDKVALARDCLALCARLAKAARAAPVRRRSSET